MPPLQNFLRRLARLILRPNEVLRRIARRIEYARFRKFSPNHSFPKLSPEYLIHREIIYGGIQRMVPRRIVSPHDPRTRNEIQSGGMQGGDRMLHNGYAKYYSKYLTTYLDEAKIDSDQRLVIAEFGILRGNGLAIWCDLFPNARILGFDIDISHFRDNLENLENMGAFSENFPEIHSFDQYENNERYLGDILKGCTIDICIDDGCHADEAITTTMKSIVPHLSQKFVYFVEDNRKVHRKLKSLYPGLSVNSHARMTVVYENQ